jgi:hypothetical protein
MKTQKTEGKFHFVCVKPAPFLRRIENALGTGGGKGLALTPTPYPEKNRVSRNRFGYPFPDRNVGAAIPVGLSVAGEETNYQCWVSDRDANYGKTNELKLIEPSVITRIQGDLFHKISRPVDVEAIE